MWGVLPPRTENHYTAKARIITSPTMISIMWFVYLANRPVMVFPLNNVGLPLCLTHRELNKEATQLQGEGLNRKTLGVLNSCA